MCFATYSAIAGYLLTSFSHNFVAVKTPLMSLQNILFIECTSTVLLTDGVKPDASDLYPRHGFTLRFNFPFSD